MTVKYGMVETPPLYQTSSLESGEAAHQKESKEVYR